MPWSWTPERRNDPEMMDAPGLPEAEVADAYRVLRRVNRHLGNLAVLRREARRFLREDRPGPARPTSLDVGTGSGDIPDALGAMAFEGRTIAAYALDFDPTAVAAARDRGVPVVRGDALRLPFADRSVDLVTAVKFAHHFEGEALDRLLSEMARVARHRVVVLDIRRHRLAYWGFIAWSRVFTRNRLVRYDGPLSVLRGFTGDELRELAAPIRGFRWEVRSYPGFQLALIGRRIADGR
ncbi:methyltransferase domain-containing protein [Tundrisphaera sp. TA3]|uniref:methyltransferase domain-containing protein n=1 Tax=Tundrisphaera sp. TA3 TaxID=3435775 RepID=UPI003EC1041E